MRQANHHQTPKCLRLVSWSLVISTALFFAACGSGGSSNEAESQMTMQLTSEAFSDGQPMPPEFTCSGVNASPPLKWTGAPSGTKSFVVICEDKDAPFGFVHWVICNIPASAIGLPKQIPADQALGDGSVQGNNDYNKIGYGGPCPPTGQHRYVFHVYAVDVMLEPAATLTKDKTDKAIKDHILAQGRLTGTYKRP